MELIAASLVLIAIVGAYLGHRLNQEIEAWNRVLGKNLINVRWYITALSVYFLTAFFTEFVIMGLTGLFFKFWLVGLWLLFFCSVFELWACYRDVKNCTLRKYISCRQTLRETLIYFILIFIIVALSGFKNISIWLIVCIPMELGENAAALWMACFHKDYARADKELNAWRDK